MVGITLEMADARLQMYLAAETRVLAKQSYEIGDRKLTYADLGEIRAGIAQWQEWVDRLNRARPARGRARRGMICGR